MREIVYTGQYNREIHCNKGTAHTKPYTYGVRMPTCFDDSSYEIT